MLNLNDFIIKRIKLDSNNNSKTFFTERLRLNKYTQIKSSFSDDNCIFIPFSINFEKLMNEYVDYKIHQENGFIIFIIPIEVIKKYSDLSGKVVYEIPNKYNNFDEIKDDYMNEKLKINTLKKLEI